MPKPLFQTQAPWCIAEGAVTLQTQSQAVCRVRVRGVRSDLPVLQVSDTLERRSIVIEILTDAVKAYQAADVMETQGEIYLKNLGMLSDSLDDLKDRHEGANPPYVSAEAGSVLPAQRSFASVLHDEKLPFWMPSNACLLLAALQCSW